MNKKALYAVIAVVVVIILVVAVLEVLPSSTPTISVSVNSTATVGQSITVAAFISGGTPSKVLINLGDGSIGTATLLSGSEYTLTHAYSATGKYLIYASAIVNGKNISSIGDLVGVTVSPATVSSTVASEISAPSIVSKSMIYAPGSKVNLTGSILQPPKAANWVVGYYIWNFGDGTTLTASTIYNTSSGNYEPMNVSHVFANAGIYPVSLAVITFNSLTNVYQSAQPYGSFTTNGTKSSQNITFSNTLYTVTFTETGLPLGTSWTVTLAGTSQSTITNSITFTEPNGNYAYTIKPVSGYNVTPAAGTVTVSGANVNQAIAFTLVPTYTVTFTETGLLKGLTWSVNLSNPMAYNIVSGNTTNLTFTVPNGTYNYTVIPVFNDSKVYTAVAGTVTVNGANVTQAITFTVAPTYTVTFTQTGLAKGLTWSVMLANLQYTFSNSTNKSSLTFTVPNGKYAFTVAPILNGSKDYVPAPAVGNVTVSSANVTQAITFTVAPTYTVTFTQTGLAKGLTWSVMLANLQYTFSNSTNKSSLTFTVPNGTYSYAVSNATFINTTVNANVNDEYLPSPAMGNITVSGKSLTQNVIYALMPVYPVTFTQTGLSSGLTWSVMLSNSQSFSSNTSTITFNEPNGSYVFTISAVNTYVPVATQGKFTYYPTSELQTILSRGSTNYQNTTYSLTIIVNSSAAYYKSQSINTNPGEITVTEVVPGGAYSFDPAIDYETVGFEEIMNVYETLIQYNGSSTSQSQMFAEVATEVPTVANGGISANYLNYTFYVRSGLHFANGDPLTAWDVYTSIVRTLLFVQGSPGTAGWILAQDLLPLGGFAPGLYSNGAALYNAITSAITVNNATQSVTFHLLKADPAFLDYIADPIGAGIVDYSWLSQHGAAITFTPAGFKAYTVQGDEAYYNNYVRYNTMGSGPYMIKSYQIGQSVTFVPNPYYTPIAGVPGFNHPANDTVYIQWEKDPSTALLIAQSGQTDIVEGLPTYDYPIMAGLQAQHKFNITPFPTLSIFWFEYNFNVNTTMLPTLGSGYTIPANYFTNLDVRRAWSYAFNYTNYIENLIGNAKYGADFAFHYTGVIPLGMPGYMNATQLQQAGAVVPVYNLTIAKQYMEESGVYNQTINIPIIVYAGDPVDFAAVQDWISTMEKIDPNIHATALYMEFSQIIGYMVAGQNPMPIYILGWAPDYPFPSDYMIPMYQENGTYGAANAWNPQTLAAAGHPNQAKEDALMNQYIADAQATGNATLALKYYDEAEALGVNLTFYTYTEQENAFWFYSAALHGVQYEQNAIYGGGGDTMYIYLWKS